MRRSKRMFLNRIMVLAFVMMWTMCVTIFADGTKGSIALTCKDGEGQTVEGGSVVLYQLATLSADGRQFVLTADFADAEIDLTAISDEAVLQAATKCVADKKLSGTKKTFDKSGKTIYTELEQGAYLVMQDQAAEGYQKMLPFIVTIPFMEADGTLILDVDASPKMEPVKPEETSEEEPSEEEPSEEESSEEESSEEESSEEESSEEESSEEESSEVESSEEEPTPEESLTETESEEGSTEETVIETSEEEDTSEEETTTEPEKIPHTGQTTWPIPFGAVSGSLFVLIGMCLINFKKEHK